MIPPVTQLNHSVALNFIDAAVLRKHEEPARCQLTIHYTDADNNEHMTPHIAILHGVEIIILRDFLLTHFPVASAIEKTQENNNN